MCPTGPSLCDKISSVMGQTDWLTHARRHLERAEWHRSNGDYEFARTELVDAVGDIWVAAREVDEERGAPRPVHLAPPHGEIIMPCCSQIICTRGTWAQVHRTTLNPDQVTCKE